MAETELAYGSASFSHLFNDSLFSVLTCESNTDRPLSDVEVGMRFDVPIDSPPLDEIVSAGDSVLLVVSDGTRATASAQIVNLVVRRVIQAGVRAGDISVIFATGIHRKATEHEKSNLLTPFITQRLRVLDHDPEDTSKLLHLGRTETGVPVEVNAALKEFSHVILTGSIGFHYFAGFTGGRKSICPGLASTRTIEATHMLALDFERGGRRQGVGTGLLDNNAVHEECDRIAELVSPDFGINTVVDERNMAVKVFCGDWRRAHRTGCDDYLANHSIDISEKRKVVIASCGGSPRDINMIQAHKTLDMAAHACSEGGTIILLADCPDGLGRADFLKWFDEPDSKALEQRLRECYEVNGQTAWSLLTKAERFRIHLVSQLQDDVVKKMRMNPCRTLDEALGKLGQFPSGYIMPRGAAILPKLRGNLS